jgi:S-adenosylmethionine synthetase
MSIQHESNINLQAFKQYVIKNIMNPVAIKYKLGTSFNKMVNNGGNFVIGGPMGDTGLTGRKIMVDTYGTVARHGGGAFSGKDYTKVDRTGAYLARYIAVNIVAAKLADRCEIQLTYAIGQSQPLSICIDTFNTNHIPTTKIYYAINKVFNLNLNYVIKQFKLDRPIYSKLSVLGHFGRLDLNLP